MDVPKYDGNIHPDEWINSVQNFFKLKNINDVEIAISFIDPLISLPTGIDSLEKLRNALKEDITFMVFKDTNKRLLRLLKYIPEKEGGNTSKFILKFRKLCYNADINDIEEQKNYFCNSLPNNNDNDRYNYLLEFIKRKEKINSMNDLIKEFKEIITDESNLIRNESIVALKHVATGKYLSSIENLSYTTGSESQMAFVSSQVLGPDALWKIIFDRELAPKIYHEGDQSEPNYNYDSHYIKLQHINSDKFLGIQFTRGHKNIGYNTFTYHKSPISEHTEVCCSNSFSEIGNNFRIGNRNSYWEVIHSKLENRQRYLMSNDIINLSVIKFHDIHDQEGQYESLRSHDIQFTIGNDTFQEIVCHNESLGENDEWCIELIKQD